MVNKKGEIQSEATIKEQHYKVISTKRGESNSVWSARDTIRNETTGVTKEQTRKEWFNLFKKYELQRQ